MIKRYIDSLFLGLVHDLFHNLRIAGRVSTQVFLKTLAIMLLVGGAFVGWKWYVWPMMHSAPAGSSAFVIVLPFASIPFFFFLVPGVIFWYYSDDAWKKIKRRKLKDQNVGASDQSEDDHDHDAIEQHESDSVSVGHKGQGGK